MYQRKQPVVRALISLLTYAGLMAPLAMAGIPEPRMMLYGQVRDDSGAVVTSGALTWTYTAEDGSSVVIETDLEAIDAPGGPFSYMVRVPLESAVGDFSVSDTALSLSEEPVNYERTAEIEGLGVVMSHDVEISTADRGVIRRVDICTTCPAEVFVGEGEGEGMGEGFGEGPIIVPLFEELDEQLTTLVTLLGSSEANDVFAAEGMNFHAMMALWLAVLEDPDHSKYPETSLAWWQNTATFAQQAPDHVDSLGLVAPFYLGMGLEAARNLADALSDTADGIVPELYVFPLFKLVGSMSEAEELPVAWYHGLNDADCDGLSNVAELDEAVPDWPTLGVSAAQREAFVLVALGEDNTCLMSLGSVALSGSLVDASGAAITCASVWLTFAGDLQGRVRTTDLNGTYSFSDLYPVMYDMTVFAPGFEIEMPLLDLTGIEGPASLDPMALVAVTSDPQIFGDVIAETGDGVGAAFVELINISVEPEVVVDVTFTCATGAFEILEISQLKGETLYALRVTAPGFETITVPATPGELITIVILPEAEGGRSGCYGNYGIDVTGSPTGDILLTMLAVSVLVMLGRRRRQRGSSR